MTIRPLAYLPLLFLMTCGSPDTEPVPTASSATTPTVNSAVHTGPLEQRAVSQEISCTGRIEVPPTDLFSVHARTAGQVTDIRYIPGDYVKKGALLLRITNPGLIEKQRLLLEARASLQQAEREFARQETLAAGDATTAEQYDATRGRLALLRATYAGLGSELERYGVDLDGLEKEGKFQSSFGIYAPASAFVHEVAVNEGMMIVPTDEVMELAGTDRVHLELQVPAPHISRLRIGQEVLFTTPSDSSSGTARIEKINPMIDAQTSTLQVHCELEQRDAERLRPGQFLNATVLTGTAEIYGLPRDAVLKEGLDYYAYRLVDSAYEKTALRDVTVTDDFISFSNPPGDTWVTAGAYYLAAEEE